MVIHIAVPVLNICKFFTYVQQKELLLMCLYADEVGITSIGWRYSLQKMHMHSPQGLGDEITMTIYPKKPDACQV